MPVCHDNNSTKFKYEKVKKNVKAIMLLILDKLYHHVPSVIFQMFLFSSAVQIESIVDAIVNPEEMFLFL